MRVVIEWSLARQQRFLGIGANEKCFESDLADVSNIDISACGIWPQWYVYHVLKALRFPANGALEPRYQNDTPFHRTSLFNESILLPIYLFKVSEPDSYVTF